MRDDSHGPDVAAVAGFLDSVTRWAPRQAGVLAVGLAGSWARGAASPLSDVDLVVVVTDPDRWLADDAWLADFGSVTRVEDEDWGLLRSRRVFFADGLEVEFGITTEAWTRPPLDPGTRGVIADGFRVLYDLDGALGRAVAAVRLAGPGPG